MPSNDFYFQNLGSYTCQVRTLPPDSICSFKPLISVCTPKAQVLQSSLKNHTPGLYTREGECGPNHSGGFCLSQCNENGFEMSNSRWEFFSGDSLGRVEGGIEISELLVSSFHFICVHFCGDKVKSRYHLGFTRGQSKLSEL